MKKVTIEMELDNSEFTDEELSLAINKISYPSLIIDNLVDYDYDVYTE